MAYYDEKLREVLSFYESLENMYKHELDTSPDGKLICQNNHGKTQFFAIDNH